jgi:hypothetical protein
VRRLLAFALTVVFAATVQAETVAVGARVRATLMAHSEPALVGTLLELRPGALAIEVVPDSSERVVPRVDVAKLEVSRGLRSNAGPTAKKCAVVFGLGLAAMGVVAGMTSADLPEGAALYLGAGLGVGGALFGGALGALVGAGSKSERWREVEVP